MTWSNGKPRKSGNYNGKTKWTHSSNRRYPGSYYSGPRRPQREGGQRSRGRAPVAYRSNPGAFTKQRKAYGNGYGNGRRYPPGGGGYSSNRAQKKSPAEAHVVEVITTNGDAVVIKDESVRASCVRITNPAIPSSLVEGFDGNAGYKVFSESHSGITRNLGQFWQRRIVFTAGPAVPHHQISPRGSTDTQWQQPEPARLDDPVNSHIVSLLFGQCRGADTTVRVRDLLYGKASAPGVTILESPTKPRNVSGKAGSTTQNWAFSNALTPTKKSARMRFKARSTGAFGPELFELSQPHVYVFTVFVAGYAVLGHPVPLSKTVGKGRTLSEDSDMVDLSNLKVGDDSKSGKKIKTEPGTNETIPIILPPPMDVPTGKEAKALLDIENDKAELEAGELFEISIVITMWITIYKKFV